MVGEVGGQAAVVGFQESLEDQAGEQLGLAELLGTERVGKRAQAAAADGQGLLGDPQRGFG